MLNRWCSVDNTFEGNDYPYANNNGFECWAPGNTFVCNKANHCSYGFWLGGSRSNPCLRTNEASFNGLKEGNHNSPHLPQASHAGIVFMFDHLLLRRAAIAASSTTEPGSLASETLNPAREAESPLSLDRRSKWPNNNRWGFYARFADWISLNGNQLDANSNAAVEASDGVTRLTTSNTGFEEFYKYAVSPSRLNVQIPESITAGRSFNVTIDGVKVAQPKIEWDFGDGTKNEKESAAHTYSQSGFYRLGVNAIGNLQSQLGSYDVFVISRQPELGSNPDEWSFQPEPGLKVVFNRDTQSHISGADSIFADVRPYHGFLVQFVWHPKAGAVSLQSHTKLSFWLKAINPNLPGWQSENPELRLTDSQGRKAVLKPKRDWLSGSSVNEARTGWLNIQVPIAGDGDWNRHGDPLHDIAELSIGLDSWDAGPLQVWIDGLTIEP
ncbi:MAG: PKD domain-containing protein [Pirellulales bacterium]